MKTIITSIIILSSFGSFAINYGDFLSAKEQGKADLFLGEQESEEPELESLIAQYRFLAFSNPMTKNSTGPDTNKIRINNTLILIIDEEGKDEDSDSLIVDIKKDTSKTEEKKDYSFNHWGGMYLGVNMLHNDQMSIAPVKGYEYLELKPASSIHFQVNAFQKDFKIAGEYLKLVTGLGIDYRQFSFEQDFTLLPGTDSILAAPAGVNFKRNKLTTWSVRGPLLLGFNLGKKKNTLHMTAGVIGEYRMGMNLNQKFELNDEKHKIDYKNPYNVNRWNASAVAGIGIGDVYLYGEYQLTSFFEKDLAPAVQPVTLGLRIINF